MAATILRFGLLLTILASTVSCATPQSTTIPTPASSSFPTPKNPIAELEKSMVFAPTRFPEGNWKPAGLAFEDAWFKAADGTKLHGWYCPHEKPKAVVLFCHGNAGNLSDRAGVVRLLHDRIGISVMIFDYRGYGRSEGQPSEAGILQDAQAARRWLAKRAGVDEGDVVLMGRSLGGGVAVDLAAADGARGLVLESTFTSLPDVAGKLMPWVPAKLLMQTRLNSLAKIGNYRGPLLQSHGDADRLIPYEFGQRLFANANQPKTFVRIPGGDHNDPQTAEYYRALEKFLTELPEFKPKDAS